VAAAGRGFMFRGEGQSSDRVGIHGVSIPWKAAGPICRSFQKIRETQIMRSF
jgi:hypothetical protein